MSYVEKFGPIRAKFYFANLDHGQSGLQQALGRPKPLELGRELTFLPPVGHVGREAALKSIQEDTEIQAVGWRHFEKAVVTFRMRMPLKMRPRNA